MIVPLLPVPDESARRRTDALVEAVGGHEARRRARVAHGDATAVDVVVLPAASRATAVSECEPFAISRGVPGDQYGAEESSIAEVRAVELELHADDPVLSLAVAVTEIVFETVAPAAGAVTAPSAASCRREPRPDELADRRHAVRVEHEQHVVAGRRQVRVRRGVHGDLAGACVKFRNWKRWFWSNACVTEGERISETFAICAASGVVTSKLAP